MYISLRTKTLPLGKVFKQKHDLCGVPPLWLGQNSSLPYLQKFLISTHLSASQQLHSSGLHRVYPAHVQCDPQPRIGREPACWCPGTLCIFLFFFLITLTHIFHTYYDPQTHFCLLNIWASACSKVDVCWRATEWMDGMFTVAEGSGPAFGGRLDWNTSSTTC